MKWNLFSIPLWLFLATGCQQQMAEQPSYEPLEPSRFFADGQSARHVVPGTVPRGRPDNDPQLFSGLETDLEDIPLPLQEGPRLDQAEHYVDRFPVPITSEVMLRGGERFDVYCVPCHDRAGTGSGEIVEHGFPSAASYHTDRLREAPLGYFVDVMTRGHGKMPPYGKRVEPTDRWAIAAYIRALQLSRHAEWKSLPAEIRERFAEEAEREP